MKYLFITALCISSSFLHASDIFVSTNTGSNENSGTVKQPIKSLQRAVKVAKPGDRIILQASDYVGSVRIHRSDIQVKKVLQHSSVQRRAESAIANMAVLLVAN